MKKISSEEKRNLPNTLLLDPATGRAAAYNGTHRLVTSHASAALVEYAQRKGHKEVKFDTALHAEGLPDWRPLPAWATAEVQARLLLVWARSGNETEQELANMPRE